MTGQGKQKAGILDLAVTDLEWLYVPNVEYADYGGCKRYLQMIVPYKPYWQEEKFPLVVFIPGSAWYEQDMYSKVPMLGRLAEYGYVVAAVQYRGSKLASFPAQVQDAKAAIRFLRSRAEEYHLDTENVFVFGDSSGGHTALLAGFTQDNGELDSDLYPGYSCSVSGIIDYSGPAELLKCRQEAEQRGVPANEPMPLDDLFGGRDIRSIPELVAKASCLEYIKREIPIPPVLIFHGDNDQVVCHTQSELLYQTLLEQGKEAEFYLIPGAGHGGPPFWGKEVLNLIHNFLQTHIR